MITAKYDNNIVGKMCSKKETVPDTTKFICKKCGRKVATLYQFPGEEEIFRVETSHLNVICGAHPTTGSSEEHAFILCLCFWDKFAEKLSKIRPPDKLHECENPNPEKDKGFFLTAKETRNDCFNIIFRWQMSKKDFLEILLIIRSFDPQKIFLLIK